VIGKRLSRLSRPANQLLQASAVLGEPLMSNVLGAMLDLEPALLLDALEEVVAAGLVREQGEQYHFSHALVRETVYRGLTVARRQHLHLSGCISPRARPFARSRASCGRARGSLRPRRRARRS